MGAPPFAGSFPLELQPQAFIAYLGVTILSLLVTLALGYLAAQVDRISGLRAVTASYAFNSLRLLAFISDPLIGKAAALFATNLFYALASVFLIAGALRMAGLRTPVRALAAVALAGTAVAVWGSHGDLAPAIRALLMALLGATAQFFFAWALYRLARGAVFRGYLVVASLAAALGALRLATPLMTSHEAQFAGLLIASTLYLGTAVALIIALQRSQYLELRGSSERLTTILALSPVAISITTLIGGRIRYVNPAWCRLTGYSAGEAVGRTMRELEIWTGDDRRRDQLLQELRAGPAQFEHAYVDRHGGRRHSLVSAMIFDLEGEQCALAISQDVSAAVEARQREAQLTDRLATVFRVSPVPLVVTARDDGRFLEVNERWLALEGRRREEVIGRTGAELGVWVDPAERERMLEELERVGRLRNFLTRFKRGGGETVDCVVAAEPVDWEGVPALLLSSHDVTELENARREAQAARERFEAILEHSPVAISITRFEDGRLRYVNPAWSRQTGFAREDALGRTTTEVGVWASTGARDAGMLQQLAADGSAHFERTFSNKAGRKVHALVSTLSIEFGGEHCVLAISLDVTAAEEGRRRAGEATERLAKVFNLSPAPLVVTTLESGHFLEVNDAWLDFYGGRRGDVIGRNSLGLGHWAEPADRVRLLEALRKDGHVRKFVTRFRRRDGSIADCIFSAETIDWDGTPAILASLQDVSELRRVNESLEVRVRERTAELEQTLGELEAFSYSVSHDLRAPLRAMSSFASLLAARSAVAGDAQAANYAERITRAAGRMAEIVNELLRYSRLARQPIETRSVALDDEVRAIARELGEQAGERRIRWEFGDLPVVRADPMLLRLVLQNLMDNAVKYSRQRDEAVISVTARDDAAGNVEIAVTDNGVGFDMAHAANLFRPFQRLHDEKDFEGTGIGLAHAKRIVERHGGRLWGEATPGQGATFRFTLPR